MSTNSTTDTEAELSIPTTAHGQTCDRCGAEYESKAIWGTEARRVAQFICPHCERENFLAVAVTDHVDDPRVIDTLEQRRDQYPLPWAVATIAAHIDADIAEAEYHVLLDDMGVIRISPQTTLEPAAETELLTRLQTPATIASVEDGDIIVRYSGAGGIEPNGGGKTPSSPLAAAGPDEPAQPTAVPAQP